MMLWLNSNAMGIPDALGARFYSQFILRESCDVARSYPRDSKQLRNSSNNLVTLRSDTRIRLEGRTVITPAAACSYQSEVPFEVQR